MMRLELVNGPKFQTRLDPDQLDAGPGGTYAWGYEPKYEDDD